MLLHSENKKGAGRPDTGKTHPPFSTDYVRVYLALADSEHFRATGWAYTLSCRLAILHGYRLSILHFLLSAALHTIRLHSVTSFHLY